MHQKQQTPWLAPRLAVGNSLVGARFEVWLPEDFVSDEALLRYGSSLSPNPAPADSGPSTDVKRRSAS